MNKPNTYVLKFRSLLAMAIIAMLMSCSTDDEVTVEAPIGDFSFVINETNDREVAFTANVVGADTYAWDFGDNIGTSNDENPTYTYPDYGNYTVALTAANAGGEIAATSDLTLSNPQVVLNGSFDDDSNWTTINHYEEANENGTVSIANGVVLFEENTNTDWKHLGVYQAVMLSAGMYQFDMKVKYAEINDVWGEVYLGQEAPVVGSDYGPDQGARRILTVYNAWDCANKTYNGQAIATGCDIEAVPGQVSITTAGTYYLLFRTGGGQYGANGIALDNVSMLKVGE
ncbi:MAG: PKD repeat protein [Marivirga sp.]|jgi:PKD repeat protein